MPDELPQEYILGIDLGSNSLGWAIVGLIDGEPAQLVRAGARVFEAGMDGDLSSGREESRNLKRREARSHRRLLWRRRRRLTKLFNLLSRSGLLPAVQGVPSAASGNHHPPLTPDQLQDYFNNLDREIVSSPWFKSKASAFPEPEHTMPYILRASALDEPLEPSFLGRAIYHLAQRRGFLSNRKQAAKKNDDEGAVKEGIADLRKAMLETHARSLGEYFSRLDPSAERIRRRWTARDMYEQEFNAIWEAQAAHHPDLLTPERKKQIHDAIFFQRPLWFDRNTIGKCELEPGKHRAARSSFVAQRFRLLQVVNNLRLQLPDRTERSLTREERAELVQELEIKGDHTLAHARDLLKLPKKARFTIEQGGEKTLRGNRTTAEFCAVFGQQRWLEEMSAEEHDQALHDVLSIQKEDALMRRAIKHWKLGEESAKKLARISPEPDYFKFSRKAIEKFLPLLEIGVTEAEARLELYPEVFEARQPVDSLPRLVADETRQAVGEIRNPTVTRSLTELRKVVNCIVRSYGKPAQIRIELARDFKRSKKDRKKLTDRNRDNEAAREKMKKKILEEAGLANPSGTDIRKALLWDECGGICPYTGRPIDFRHLFGHETQFDIEHIIPYERCFDNSFSNLTLCYNQENRHVKGKRTPREAYDADEARYEEILDRVKRFHSPSARAKLWRFQMTEREATEFVSKFVSRQLNDTRYASRLAAKYVAMLYGGKSDEEHTMRVHVSSGEVTAQLRRSWLLNRILNDGPTANGGSLPKSREDHRHHAVDAVAIALTDDSTIQQLSRAWQEAHDRGQRKASLKAPWGKDLAEFVDSVRGEIDKIVVSHRVSKKVSGALHEETIYSPPMGEKGEVRVRKPLASLTNPEVEKIADEGVRKLVQQKLEELGGIEPKKAFSNAENLPKFPSSGVVIRKVRITKPERPTVIGDGRTKRHVISGNNHHVEIYAELGRDGNEKQWGGEVVPMLDALQRLRDREPIVQRDHGPLVEFKFSLAKGDTVELQDEGGRKSLWVARKIGAQVSLIPVNDARKIERYFSPRINGLFKRQARKVAVSPLGKVTEAHD